MSTELEERFLEKLEKLEKLRDKGLITEEKFTQEEAKIKNKVNKLTSSSYKRKGVIINIFIWGIFFLIILFSVIHFSGSSSTPTNTPLNQPDLDLTIKRTSEGLQIANNEEGSLLNCTVRINDKYIAKLPNITDGTSGRGFISYGGFSASNGERFNIYSTSIKNVLVEHCSNAQGRIGIYGS